MRRMGFIIVSVVGLLLVSASGAVSGPVSIITGAVEIMGHPAPAGTAVEARLGDGTLLGASLTGCCDADSYQYRIDILDPADGEMAFLYVGGQTQPAGTVILVSYRVHVMDLAVRSESQRCSKDHDFH